MIIRMVVYVYYHGMINGVEETEIMKGLKHTLGMTSCNQHCDLMLETNPF